MHNSLDVSAPGHSPWILDWTCFRWTPLCHVEYACGSLRTHFLTGAILSLDFQYYLWNQDPGFHWALHEHYRYALICLLCGIDLYICVFLGLEFRTLGFLLAGVATIFGSDPRLNLPRTRCEILWQTLIHGAMAGSTGASDASRSSREPPVDPNKRNGDVQNEALPEQDNGSARGPGWGELCTNSCLHHGHHKGKEMIRCCACAIWVHTDCIANVEEYLPGVWPCFDCRKLPTNVSQLSKSISNLTQLVVNLTNTVTLLKEKHDSDMVEMKAMYEKLVVENNELRNRFVDTSATPASIKTPQNSPSSHGTLVIGSSIVRDIDERKLVATRCISIGGGRIKNIHDKLDTSTNGRLSRLIILVGGNDCDGQSPSTDVTNLLAQYRDLIADAKMLADSVTICSVCPRQRSAEVSACIAALNAGLVDLCCEMEVEFLDNDPSFYLKDGSLNDGYLLPDKVHLTRAATNRLVSNMKLALRQGVDSAHLDHRRRQMQQQSESDTVPASAPMEDYQHPFWQKARQKAHPKAHLRPPTGNFARPSNSHQPQIPPSKPRTAPTRPISTAPPTGTRQPQQSPHKTWNSHRAVL